MKKATLLKIITASSMLISSSAAFAATQSSFTDQQQQEISAIVHSYLVQNPEVLIEVSNILQKKQMDAIQSQAIDKVLANKNALFANSSDPAIGNPKSTVTIVEFFDYQ